MPKTTKKVVGVKEDLSSILASTLNDESKDGRVAYFLEGDVDVPTNVTDWVSTGQSILDLAISNKPHCGFPVGRIVEITGLEQSGKSLLAAHALSETQKKDGIAVLIDTENSVNKEFYTGIGMDLSKLVYAQAQTVEQIFEIIETIIEKVRTSNTKDKLVTIVVDSVAGAYTLKEIEADYGKDGWATDKAIIISKAMRKITNTIGREKILLIFTNQLRQKLGAMPFADQWTTSGGKALAFHSSIQIRLNKMGMIKDKKNNVIGIKTRAKLMKNRMGPPLKTADFDIYFASGIDNYGSWISVMKTHNIVKGAAHMLYTYKGEEIKFQTATFLQTLADNPGLEEELYDKICDKLILTYKEHSLDVMDSAIHVREEDEATEQDG